MLGFIIGTVSLIGLIRVLRRGPRHHLGGGPFGHGCHGPRHRHGRHHGPGRHGGPGGFFGRRAMHRLFERLDTTPEQERVIHEAFSDAFAEATKLRELGASLGDATRETMSRDIFADELLEHAFVEQDVALARLRESIKHGLKEIHEVLSEEQRRELSKLMRGWGFGPFTPFDAPPPADGPYR